MASWVDSYVESIPDAKAQAVSLGQITGAQALTGAVIDPFPHDGAFDPEVRVLWGRVGNTSGWCPHDSANLNNHSLVVRVNYG